MKSDKVSVSPPSAELWIPKEAALEMLQIGARELEKKAQRGIIRRQRVAGRALFLRDDVVRVAEAREANLPITPPHPNGALQPADRRAGILEVLAEATAREAPPREWLTLPEAEAECGLPAKFLHRLIVRGALPAFDVGSKRRDYRVARRDLAALRAPSGGTASDA